MKLFTIEYWACAVKRWSVLCFFRGTFREALKYGRGRFDRYTSVRVRRVNSNEDV